MIPRLVMCPWRYGYWRVQWTDADGHSRATIAARLSVAFAALRLVRSGYFAQANDLALYSEPGRF